MANFPNYSKKSFTVSQNFLARDPSGGGDVIRVQGQSILDAAVLEIQQSGNIVNSIDTLTQAITTDYPSGQYVLTGGSAIVLDGDQSIYRVSDPGSGGIVMTNGNELMLLFQANTGDAGDYNVGSADGEIPTNAIADTLRIKSVASIADLPPVVIGNTISTNGYHPASTAGGIGKGVGKVARHDGVINFDPTRVAEIGTAAYYVNSGVDADCWVRTSAGYITLAKAGAKFDASDESAVFAAAASLQKVIEFNDDEISINTTAVTTHLNLFGKGRINLIDNATTHMFTLGASANYSLTFTGEFTLDGNKLNQVVAPGLGPDLISAQAVVNVFGKLTLQNGQRYGLKTNGPSGLVINHIAGLGMDNDVVQMENSDNSSIDLVTSDASCSGHTMKLKDDCQGNTIGRVNGFTVAPRFALELFSDNAKATAPRYNTVGEVNVNGQNSGGGVSISGAHNNTINAVNAIDCPSVASLEFAQGASDNTVGKLVAENCNRLALTGTGAKRIARNVVGHATILGTIANSIGIYFFEADGCHVNSAIIKDVNTNHSIRMQNANKCKVTNFSSDGGSGVALEGVLIDGSSNQCEITDGTIENHTVSGRFAIKDTTTNTNFFARIKCRNNFSFFTIPATSQAIDIQNNDGPLAGSVTLTAGTATTVINSSITSLSRISLLPTNAAAAALTGIYISAKNSQTSFVITHSTAAGTETFDYTID
jgi:hypothetical protein